MTATEWNTGGRFDETEITEEVFCESYLPLRKFRESTICMYVNLLNLFVKLWFRILEEWCSQILREIIFVLAFSLCKINEKRTFYIVGYFVRGHLELKYPLKKANLIRLHMEFFVLEEKTKIPIFLTKWCRIVSTRASSITAIYFWELAQFDFT